MKLISLNIELNKHRESMLTFLEKEKPDVFCLQELLEDDFEMVKERTGMAGAFVALSVVDHPVNADVVGKKQGVGIFAKNIQSSGSIFYEERHAVLWADIVCDARTYRVATTHLPVTEKGAVTEFQLHAIDALIAHLDTLGEFILCGDMNAPRGREAFGKLAERYTDWIPAEYMTSLDQNLHRVKGLIFMVDGLFTTAAYQAREVSLVDGVSDHMAIRATVALSY